MNINLANIDFVPGQGGGGEAVIRSLDVTENGTYSAPSGVDGYNPVNVNVSGGSSITPEEQDALDTLVNSSEGVLNTVEIKANNLNQMTWGYGDFFSNYYLYSMVDGSIYNFDHPKLYKLDPKSMNFKLILDNVSSTIQQPLWMDNSGRMFQGTSKEIDLTTGSVTGVNLNSYGYVYRKNRLNLFYGDRGIWIVPNTLTNLKLYDEQLKQFTGTYTTTLPQDYSGNIAEDICYVFTYKGHKLFHTDANKTYEVVETNDGLTVTDVTGVYFPIPTTFTISDPYFIFSTENGNLWYMYNNNKYVYKGTGNWESFTITSDNNIDYPFNNNYVVYGNCVFGGANLPQGIYSIINLGQTLNATGWTPVNNIAVDLESRQDISGVKHFTAIDTSNLSIWYVSSPKGKSHIELNNNKTKASSIELTVLGSFTLNGVSVATTDNCFINRSYLTSGPIYKGICVAPDSFYFGFFKTPSGRLIYDNGDTAYEFDGTQFNQLQTVTIHSLGERYITITDGLFTKDIDNLNLIKWNDTASNWEVVLDLINEENIWAADANTLRLGYTHKLSNTDGTYSWVEDAINTSEPLGKTYLIGQNVYMPQENSQRVSQYDESTKTLTFIGDTKEYPVDSHWFVFENELYYLDNVSVRKLNPSQVGTDQWDIPTKILYTGWDSLYIEYNNKLYITNPNSENNFGYCYGFEETTPEVPASDGTYSLKAVRSGDQITYNWVLDA